MNRINTNYNGGFPLNLNDLRFNDDAIRLALRDIMRGLAGDQAVVIFGCQIVELETENYQVSEGAIFYQGEIWHVYQHTVDYPDVPNWAFYVSHDPDGNKMFKDGIQHNTYEVRNALLCLPGSYPEGTLYTISADQVLNLKDVFLEVGWADPTLMNGTTIVTGSGLLLGKSLKTVTLHGKIHVSIDPVGLIVLNIPAGFRPTLATGGYLQVKTSTDDIITVRYILGTDGNLTYFTLDEGHGLDIDVCLTFFTAY